MTQPVLVVRDPANRDGDFGETARGLALAATLAALARMVDAIGYLHLKSLFFSLMSGKSRRLSASPGDLTGGHNHRPTDRAVVLGAAGQMLADLAARCILVRFGQGLDNFLFRRVTGWNWLAQAAPWFGTATGATIGGAAYVRVVEPQIWVPIALAGVFPVDSTTMPQPD